MQIWLILTSLTWFGQFHAAAVISKDHKAIQPNGQNWHLKITARHLMFHNSHLCQQLQKHHYNPSLLQLSQSKKFQGQNLLIQKTHLGQQLRAHLTIQSLLQPQGQNLKIHLSQKKRTRLKVAASQSQSNQFSCHPLTPRREKTFHGQLVEEEQKP
jgi:hypothetical protein